MTSDKVGIGIPTKDPKIIFLSTYIREVGLRQIKCNEIGKVALKPLIGF